jgi:hypothetical protein
VDKTILYSGLACIIAAIVGGGVKAFGVEIPLLSSLKRQSLLAIFGLALIVVSVAADRKPPETPNGPPRPNLAIGTWTLHDAIDRDGGDWTNSTLKFTSQEVTPEGLTLRGTFTWRLKDRLLGTENVSGQYLSTGREIILEGQSVSTTDPSVGYRLAVGSYSAVLADDERSLVKGHWGSTMGNEPATRGQWEATR